MVHLVVVGEAPSTNDPVPAFSNPRGTRSRLARLAGVHDLARVVPTVNLFSRPVFGWDHPAAVIEAAELVSRYQADCWLLAGRRVAAAFGVQADWMTWVPEPFGMAAIFPHPSGRSRWWNDPERVEWARQFLQETLGR